MVSFKKYSVKKFVLAIFFIIFFSNISFGANFKWTFVGKTGDSSSAWYYEKKSVFKVGDYRYYWIMSDYLKDVTDGISSVIGLHMVNCKTYESKWMTYSGYNLPMGKGRVVSEYVIPVISPEDFRWRYFNPTNTVYGSLLKKVCNERVNN